MMAKTRGKLTQTEFYDIVNKVKRDNPKWRVGQSLFNTLWSLRPDISETIRGTANDPFHATTWDDPRVVAAMKVINLMWEDK